MSEDSILKLDEDDFDDRIQDSRIPILVDFWASWCQPCKIIAPTLRGIAEQYAGRARVAKVNVDENGDLANRFGIRSIPTLVVFKNGKVVDQLIGAAPEDQIKRLLDRHLDS